MSVHKNNKFVTYKVWSKQHNVKILVISKTSYIYTPYERDRYIKVNHDVIALLYVHNIKIIQDIINKKNETLVFILQVSKM